MKKVAFRVINDANMEFTVPDSFSDERIQRLFQSWLESAVELCIENVTNESKLKTSYKDETHIKIIYGNWNDAIYVNDELYTQACKISKDDIIDAVNDCAPIKRIDYYNLTDYGEEWFADQGEEYPYLFTDIPREAYK